MVKMEEAVNPQETGPLSIGSLIHPVLKKEGIRLRRITDMAGEVDIRTNTFVYSSYQAHPCFPTVFFVESDFGELLRSSCLFDFS